MGAAMPRAGSRLARCRLRCRRSIVNGVGQRIAWKSRRLDARPSMPRRRDVRDRHRLAEGKRLQTPALVAPYRAGKANVGISARRPLARVGISPVKMTWALYGM